MTSLQRRLDESLPPLVAVVTLCIAGLLAVFGFGTAAAAAAVVGWFLLTPLSAILGKEVFDARSGTGEAAQRRTGTLDARDPAESPGADPLDRLRERYAEGDIDEAEFERRLDLLLDTEGADAEATRERLRERNG